MQQKILSLKQQGKTYEEIAQLLQCSISTVWYYLDPSAKATKLARNKAYKKELRDRIKQEFGGRCSLCGYSTCLDALEFHHTHPEGKDESVTRLILFGSYTRILEEAKKCILVCAHCHREIHAGSR